MEINVFGICTITLKVLSIYLSIHFLQTEIKPTKTLITSEEKVFIGINNVRIKNTKKILVFAEQKVRDVYTCANACTLQNGEAIDTMLSRSIK